MSTDLFIFHLQHVTVLKCNSHLLPEKLCIIMRLCVLQRVQMIQEHRIVFVRLVPIVLLQRS